jgi:hypothetical protein
LQISRNGSDGETLIATDAVNPDDNERAAGHPGGPFCCSPTGDSRRLITGRTPPGAGGGRSGSTAKADPDAVRMGLGGTYRLVKSSRFRDNKENPRGD